MFRISSKSFSSNLIPRIGAVVDTDNGADDDDEVGKGSDVNDGKGNGPSDEDEDDGAGANGVIEPIYIFDDLVGDFGPFNSSSLARFISRRRRIIIKFNWSTLILIIASFPIVI